MKKDREGTDTEQIKKSTEALSTEMQKIGEAMAKQNPQNPQGNPGQENNGQEGNVRDAETK